MNARTDNRSDGDYEAAVAMLNAHRDQTLMATLDIVYTRAGADFLEATMPVEAKCHQPMGILHGGASAALAESVASAASALQLRGTDRQAVGLELAINHLGAIRSGTLRARAEAIHLGRSTHLWQIDIRDQSERRIALAKLTMMVLDRES